MDENGYEQDRKKRYEYAVDRIRNLYDQIIRFGFLANAGGAVAALSFMGASWATGGAVYHFFAALKSLKPVFTERP